MEGKYYFGRAGYRDGIAIENTVKALNIRPPKSEKEIRIEEDSNVRRDLNKNIAELIAKEPFKNSSTIKQWVAYIHKKFPNETEESIQIKIEHWQEKYEALLQIIDNMIEDIRSGERTIPDVEKALEAVLAKRGILRKPLKAYYASKLKEISDIEEER